ncbi:ABC transporter permease [Phocicoccus pinnipedialis]|uniref:Putative iron export permease protein FetB n=1 Tax=Phocicoccus pinnipedialis TaxID=110845 RepID=A0A6V7R760_9BACL|nr:iron export ABC transporter permease subunit FetB [Jeotgalicoccus pinnipedialis]MBP1938863.1 putative ABC transport system permease protein [Jeotgalicoccus pinnipedialis]CAD2073297.1 putative iron export permease protein FetB [Jeotgalicoccus pinnipedialis]
MSITSLALSLVFVIIPLILTAYLKLGLTKDILIATVRSIIQLIAVGYILTFVFEGQNAIYIILMIMLMIGAASQNIVKKGKGIPYITWIIILALVVVEVFSMTTLVVCNIIPFTPQYVIPISGMIIGNTMVLSLLFLNKFKSEVNQNDEIIELILSFGGTPEDAIKHSLKSAIKTSMIPTIEAQKTMGLVQLPGMMSGLIIGGGDPLEAVMYQLLILFLILNTAAVASVLVGYLSYRHLFNARMQFIGIREDAK